MHVSEKKNTLAYCSEASATKRRQVSAAKMTSPVGKLTALACHSTKRVNKAEELTYLSTNNGIIKYPTKMAHS
jgi:hypothetical protein